MPRTAGLILVLLALGPWATCAAQPFGTITILEGEAMVLRGPGRVHALEGLRLAAADIVEVAEKGFAQIELGDRIRLLLGPQARVLLQAAPSKQKPEPPSVYAIAGWFKLVGSGRDPQANLPALQLRSSRFELPAARADVVVRISAEQIDAFAESGTARLLDRISPTATQPLELKPGQHYSRKMAERGAVQLGPPQAFVAAMPRAFRDSLPARIGQFANKEIVAKAAPDFSYEEVEAWLKADPQVRRPLVARWRHKSREPAFRAALIANMAAHMEWDRILFPEKYLPKQPPPPAALLERTAPAYPSKQ